MTHVAGAETPVQLSSTAPRISRRCQGQLIGNHAAGDNSGSIAARGPGGQAERRRRRRTRPVQ